jgi:hypothetical protein
MKEGRKEGMNEGRKEGGEKGRKERMGGIEGRDRRKSEGVIYISPVPHLIC